MNNNTKYLLILSILLLVILLLKKIKPKHLNISSAAISIETTYFGAYFIKLSVRQKIRQM